MAPEAAGQKQQLQRPGVLQERGRAREQQLQRLGALQERGVAPEAALTASRSVARTLRSPIDGARA